MGATVPKNILVTGADRGLGRALAAHFLAEGRDVFAGVVDQGREELGGLKAGYPSQLTLVPLDVAEPDSIHRAVQLVSEHTDSLDMLVNNAGVHLENKHTPLEELNLEDGHLERSMAVNAFGIVRVAKACLRLLEQGSFKRIANITSEAGSLAACWRDREFAYGMSKSAANMATKLLHNYLKARGFTVMAIHPGWIRSDMGGPEADLDPAESAAAVAPITVDHYAAAEAPFIDYRGNRLAW